MSPISVELLKKIPKTDLHVHLDGSIRLETLIDLAKEYGVELPSYTSSGLRETVFKDKYSSLVEYLQGFNYTCAVLQSETALERVAYEFALDNQEEGVRYVEVRFAPQLHVHYHLSIEHVLKSVDRGLARAKREFNQRQEVREGREPPFEYAIIVCALRFFARGLSEYFDQILQIHRYTAPKRVFALASLELAQAAVRIKAEAGIPITGFDLAGAEAGYPAEDHSEAFQHAHRHFLMKTVHAGEAYGPESIFQAITDLHADRLGHGTFLMDTSMISDAAIGDPSRYVSDLAQYIADRRITIEVCLTSNLQTNPRIAAIAEHPFAHMRDAMLSCTFCTDNRTVSSTSVSQELALALDHLGLTPADMKRAVIYGFKRSFFPGTYLEKRRYVRRIIDYYEAIQEQHPELRGGHQRDEDLG